MLHIGDVPHFKQLTMFLGVVSTEYKHPNELGLILKYICTKYVHTYLKDFLEMNAEINNIVT
jgi:hypothetical protein